MRGSLPGGIVPRAPVELWRDVGERRRGRQALSSSTRRARARRCAGGLDPIGATIQGTHRRIRRATTSDICERCARAIRRPLSTETPVDRSLQQRIRADRQPGLSTAAEFPRAALGDRLMVGLQTLTLPV